MVKLFHKIFFNQSPNRDIIVYSKEKWGVKPRNVDWYLQALRHKSLVGTGEFEHKDCNERLELLGDAVLDAAVTEYLFRELPNSTEGEITKIRSRIVNRKKLGEIGKMSGLHQHVKAKIGVDDSNDKIVGNALEAWLGAIYIDLGYEVVRKSIHAYLLHEYLDIEATIANTTDYKSQFIEWAQSQKITFSFETYAHNSDSGFKCDLYIKSEVVASEVERSKKLAEKAAAYTACQTLEITGNV